MEIKVTKNKIHLDDKSKLNENEYNINNIDFTFSEEYTQELVKIALFSANNTNYKEIITQNQCKIPSEILANEGVFVLGVYAYSTEDVYKLTEDTEIDEDKTYYTRTGSGTEEEPYEYTEVENPIAENLSTYYEKNVKLSLRYSPSPIKLVVDSGSYIPDEQTQNSEPITASELEQYQQALNDGLREAENVNISAEKVDKVATITIIDRYGDETSVEIQDGTDGIDGKDAKINGVNTLTIKAGQNIEIEQEENTLIINGQSNYNNLTNKPKINNVELTGNKTTSDLGIVIPDVSGFITKDVNNLTNYTLKTATGSLIDLEINQSTYVVTLTLKDIDGNVISTDTIDLPLESVVVGGRYDATNKKIVLTLENGNTVDIPVGDLIAGLQTEITSQNKLASDLVDDSNSGNKFTNTTEKSTWNAKYDKPAGGIPKTDLASAVQTSLDKADTAVQDVSDKENISNKVTEIDENSTDTEYPTAKLLYDQLVEKQEQIDGLVTENALLKDQIPNGTAEGTNVQITDSSNLPIEDGVIKGNTSQESTTGKNLVPNNLASGSSSGITYTVNSDGSIKLSGTATARVEPNLYFDINNPITFKAGTYRNTSSKIMILNANGYILASPNQTFTLDEDKNVIQIYFRIENGETVNETYYPQIILNSITDTSYEPYTGGQPSPNPTYPQTIHTVTGDCEVEVVNENLFNPANIIKQELCTVQNDKITITDNSSWGQAHIICGEKLYAGQYTFSIYGNSGTVSLLVMGYKNGEIYKKLISGFYNYSTYYKASVYNTVSDKKSFTLPNDCDYYYVGFALGRNGTETVTVKVEKGTNDNPTYTPHAHQTFPLSLGNEELYDGDEIEIDFVQKAGYKKVTGARIIKNMKKLLLNSTTIAQLNVFYSNSLKCVGCTSPDIANVTGSTVGAVLCDKAPNLTRAQFSDESAYGICLNNSDNRFLIRFNGVQNYNTTELIREYFRQNPYEVVHKLATPVTTPITDQTLLAQFEALINMKTYKNITNIITTGDDLAPITSIVYKKDLTTLVNQ